MLKKPEAWQEEGEDAFSLKNAKTCSEKGSNEVVSLIPSISIHANQVRYSGKTRFPWVEANGTKGVMAKIRVIQMEDGEWKFFAPNGSIIKGTKQEIIAAYPYIDSGAEFHHTREL